MRPMRACSFCGASELTADVLLAGTGAFICNECVDSAVKTMAEASLVRDGAQSTDPVALAAQLDRWVIGQDRAKRVLSVAAHNHYKRTIGGAKGLLKSNVMLIGPTGCGKTLLARTLADAMEVPFVITDVTGLTQAGYAGEDVESIVESLVRAADGDIGRAQRGVVFLDEVDKLARRSLNFTRGFLDVSGEGVQQSLLKIVEGTTVRIARSQPGQPDGFSTAGVLFIAGGAFSDLPEITRERARSSAIGFSPDSRGRQRQMAPEFDDLVEFGLLPEFLGRFPVVCQLSPLDVPQLRRVLLEPENALVPEYRTLLGLDTVDLRFDADALDVVASQAVVHGTGARALRRILEDLLTDLMFHAKRLAPGTHITVTSSDVVAGRIEQLEGLVTLQPEAEQKKEDEALRARFRRRGHG